MAMIVEFIGSPGAGKSTLHAKVAESLRTTGIEVVVASRHSRERGMLGRLSSYASACWRWRAVLRTSAILLLRSGRAWRDRLFAFRLLVVALGRYEMAGESPEGRIVLMDEGFLQRCFTVLVDGPGKIDPWIARRLVAAGPHADVVVHVHGEAEVALERIARRARGLPDRLAHLSSGDLLRTYRGAEDLFARITQVVRGSAADPARVIEVPSHDLDRAAALVLDALGASPTHVARR